VATSRQPRRPRVAERVEEKSDVVGSTRRCERLGIQPTGRLMVRCPVCDQVVAAAPAGGDASPLPFCSDRCRLIDLGRWLDEGYALPETRRPDDEEESLEDLLGPTDLAEGRDD
jgi:endogenous inhibitor of DNA gyrase (YacG/DUF329 family)